MYNKRVFKLTDEVMDFLNKNPDKFHTPTEIGLGLGYKYSAASSSVANPLKRLILLKKVEKVGKTYRTLAYSVEYTQDEKFAIFKDWLDKLSPKTRNYVLDELIVKYVRI